MKPTVQRQTVLISVTTFAVGLLIGALVLSQSPTTPIQQRPEHERPITLELEPIAAAAELETTAAKIESIDAPPESALNVEHDQPESQRLFERIDELSQNWGQIQAELAQLRERIARVEQRVPQQPAETATDANTRRSQRPSTPEEQRTALISVGVAPDTADEIVWRRAQVSLDRLDLRDQAIREDWLNTDRYRQELSRINEQNVSLRDEIGINAYDAYLFDTGQNNRVAVESVIPGSAGDENGIMPGDVIEIYGDRPVLDFQDLRSATSEGVRDELVPVTVRRGNQRIELVLPRGPIGIRLDGTLADPRG